MSAFLSVEHLAKSFGGVMPVRDVSFSVNKQSIALITGENGAGKTSLFNLIAGLERPTGGKITYNGSSIETKSALEISRLGIARLYQQPRLFRNLPVWENLVAAARHDVGDKFLRMVLKPKRARREDEDLKLTAVDLLTGFGLQNLSDLTAGELSYGQQKLISICMLAMSRARLALLDEPFAGVNPQTIEQFCEMILRMRAEGTTFLIIEHNINKASTIADTHFEMKDGLIKLLWEKQPYG